TVDNFGQVYVTGESYDTRTDNDYCTIRYDQEGNEVWIKRYNGPGNYIDGPNAIAVDNYGNVYVTGVSDGIETFSDYCTIKYIQGQSDIKKEKEISFKSFKEKKIYDITGKLIRENKLKKGIYFKLTEKGKEKILILK
ncbi:MAG: SBBP repeat-containing protein, partial [candidate division WOR-3 bacterium]|nr:SBBP repeat-containing protein [candidate division WOR-3 bacterium]